MTHIVGKDRTLFQLAAPYGGMVWDRHLRAAGITRQDMAKRRREGVAARVMPRIHAVGPLCHDPTWDMRCNGAVLMAGRDARLTGATAAHRLDLWNRSVKQIHVSAPRFVHPIGEPYVFHHTARYWEPAMFQAGSACPIAGVVDLCIQMAMTHQPWQVAWVISQARYHRLIDIETLRHVISQRHGARGNGTLRHALRLIDEGSVGTRCLTEDVGLEELLAHGIEEPLINVRGSMGLSRDEPDLYFPFRFRNIEFDGSQHRDERQQRDDALRDAEVEARGNSVLRVWSEMIWTDRRRTIRRCLHFLHGGEVDLEPGTRRLAW